MVFVSLSAHSTAEMLNNFAVDSISEQSLEMWYLAIFMTPHLKQQEKKTMVFGGWAGVSQTVLSHIWESREFFSKGICGGGGQIFFHHMKM